MMECPSHMVFIASAGCMDPQPYCTAIKEQGQQKKIIHIGHDKKGEIIAYLSLMEGIQSLSARTRYHSHLFIQFRPGPLRDVRIDVSLESCALPAIQPQQALRMS